MHKKYSKDLTMFLEMTAGCVAMQPTKLFDDVVHRIIHRKFTFLDFFMHKGKRVELKRKRQARCGLAKYDEIKSKNFNNSLLRL